MVSGGKSGRRRCWVLGEDRSSPNTQHLRAPVAVCNWKTAVASEGAGGDLGAGRRLAALVFGAVDELDHPTDGRGVEPHLDDLLEALVVLDVGLEDRVEDRVGR